MARPGWVGAYRFPSPAISAAFAGVDVDTTAPARNRVAAATAIEAPDLEFNFMTISSIV